MLISHIPINKLTLFNALSRVTVSRGDPTSADTQFGKEVEA